MVRVRVTVKVRVIDAQVRNAWVRKCYVRNVYKPDLGLGSGLELEIMLSKFFYVQVDLYPAGKMFDGKIYRRGCPIHQSIPDTITPRLDEK